MSEHKANDNAKTEKYIHAPLLPPPPQPLQKKEKCIHAPLPPPAGKIGPFHQPPTKTRLWVYVNCACAFLLVHNYLYSDLSIFSSPT